MIPAHHTESKMLSATQGPMAFWRLQRNSINQNWIIVRRSRAIHQLGYGSLPQCSDPVANEGIVLQNLNVFAEGGRPGVFAWHFFRSPDEGAAAATRRHHLLTHQLRRTSRRRDWRRTAEELDQTPQVLRGCGQ